MRDQLSLLCQALDVAGTGLVLMDPGGDDPIVYTNQAFLEMTGCTADEVLGRSRDDGSPFWDKVHFTPRRARGWTRRSTCAPRWTR
jgi:PAS domain S-box-containing protein